MIKIFAILALFLVSPELSALEVTNHKNGSVVRYPVVLLRGTYSESITIEISGVGNQSTVTHEERFKALVSLSEGENQITLKSNGEEQAFSLTYRPQKNPYYVRVIWLTDKSGDTSYATPTSDALQDYVGRLRTAAQLMQTFTAERMGDLAFGKKTFRLERDPDSHEIVIHTLKGPLSAEEYYELGDTNQYWSSIRQWLNREYPDPFAKNIVLAAFTRKDPGTGKMKGHTALGGGDLGLFGSASVFTWPESLADVVRAFSNFEIVDPQKVHNDGAGRDTYWGVASTTIGATLHEMGHTFGLPHCTDHLGIMTRGFDHFHRVFTFSDPPSHRNLKRKVFSADEEAYFAPVSASFLQWSPWLQIDRETDYESKDNPSIKIDGDDVVFSSPSGIPWVGIWVENDIHDYRVTEETPLKNEIRIPMSDLQSRLGDKPVSRVSTIAGNGRYRVLMIPN